MRRVEEMSDKVSPRVGGMALPSVPKQTGMGFWAEWQCPPWAVAEWGLFSHLAKRRWERWAEAPVPETPEFLLLVG